MFDLDDENRGSRGRPPLTPMDIERIRRGVLEATRQVFTEVGYQGLSVERVLAAAQVSRPTFYKYFHSLDEAVDQLLDEVIQDLVRQLQAALLNQPGPVAKMDAIVEAWRRWGEGLGEFLRPFHAELHNPASLVGQHRERAVALLADMIAQTLLLLGRPRPCPLRVAAFINAMEFIGYEYLLHSPGDDAGWRQTRAAMFRLALGLLGDEDDWRHALQLALEFNVDLGSD